MTEKRAQRRLAAILAADVVGYSRLMEQDEAGTLAALKARRSDVLAPVVAQHNGRVVKVMGDGVLVEFGSAVDAVQCAVELQKSFAGANRAVPENQQIVLRIGINLGDVIVEGSDIYGDGVNVAARLEGLAEPGRICVSGSVYEQVNGKLELGFDDLGDRAIKNIVKSVHVYRVGINGADNSNSRPFFALPDKPSIAVLPFVNMSGDPEQEFFTDGLTEDIITDLSNVPGFFVIARNSTFTYKGKPTDVRQIARDLGVKYILEGSARRSDNRLRVNVQLINAAEGGNHVWAQRFDRDHADIFVVQDEVTRHVVEAITGKLNAGPIAERIRPSNLGAYDLCVRARNLWSLSIALNQEAYMLLVRAVALDPNYAEVHWQLALVHLFRWIYWNDEQQSHRHDALISARHAVDLDPNDSNARWVLGFVLLHERRWDEANAHLEASLHINPNNADALAIFSDFKVAAELPKEAIELVTMALRLNPRPPSWYYWLLGQAQVAVGQYDSAVATLRREETYRTGSRRILAAALALSGRVEEAREEAKFFLADNPNFHITKWIEKGFFKSRKVAKFWFDAYRLAGLPE